MGKLLGFDPKNKVDFIDWDDTNYTAENLREVHPRLGPLPKGVYRNGSGYKAHLGRHYVGTHPTVEKAQEARDKAKAAPKRRKRCCPFRCPGPCRKTQETT